MLTTDEKINTALRAAHLRCTPGRKALLKVLQQAAGPMSAEQIAGKLGRGRLNKVTIYRALEGFVAAGLIHRAYVQDRIAYFELAHHCREHQCHPHFVCTGCGKTLCLEGKFLPLLEGMEKGYVINRQQVRLEGLCPSCS